MTAPNTITANPDSERMPGTVPAWALVFHDEITGQDRIIGSDAYDGSVTATLPAGLTGGSYEIVIEGMTFEDYQKIRGRGDPLSAELHLWWKDAPTGLARFTGLDNPLAPTTPQPPDGSLIATIRVDRMLRRPGPRRIDVVVTGRELVAAQLAEQHVDGRCPQVKDPTKSALQVAIEQAADGIVQLVEHGLEKAKAAEPPPGGPEFAAIPAGTALDAITTLAGQVQAALGLSGLPITMIRDGKLHIGEWTASTPVPRLDVQRAMDDASGLLAVERGAALPRDTRLPDGPFGPTPPRLTVAVTALGRPDVKPGDTVSVVLPSEDFPFADPPSIGATVLTSVPTLAFGAIDPDARPSTCRITDVSHKLSRENGFLTTFRATVLGSGDDGWDRIRVGTAHDATAPQQPGVPFSDSAHGVATTIDAVVGTRTGQAISAARSRPGVIHDHTVAVDTPRHTSDVWYSDTASDGLPGTAQRAAITEDAHGELVQVPYVTPFAWGSYGLVLPRYPGTRVVLANVGGGSGDFVDVGAVWPPNAGPAAKPGDYWLALPVGITEREHLTDPDKQVPDDGPATHDVIDADGNRIIETSRFVIRVTDELTTVPNRPAMDDDIRAGTVLIEAKSPKNSTAARILLGEDGTITVLGTDITFDTQGRGDIEFRANNVSVTLGKDGRMDVS